MIRASGPTEFEGLQASPLYRRNVFMHVMNHILTFIFLPLGHVIMSAHAAEPQWANDSIILGDEKTECYLPLLEGKNVAIFSNQTGCRKDGMHILDVLIRNGIRVTALFSPEHGFRGDADAGEHVSNSVDPLTGIPILSLYDGKRPGPSDKDMELFDVMVIDIQDVGLRYYTYYITMLQLMRRCSEFGHQVVILDRPNPNGHFVDGPLLDMDLKSGVGALPIPIVHGMTLGELAFMAMGEGWTGPCGLTVIPCSGYSHRSFYRLPVAPSPNLPDMAAVYLYPSTCYFEGTSVSLGRGTAHPFQVYGHPDWENCPYTFTPESRTGAKRPPHIGEECHGVDLTRLSVGYLQKLGKIDLSYVVDAYRRMKNKDDFFLRNGFFDKLTGRRDIRRMIVDGYSAAQIEATWKGDVEQFRKQRKKYLIYPE